MKPVIAIIIGVFCIFYMTRHPDSAFPHTPTGWAVTGIVGTLLAIFLFKPSRRQ